MRFDVQLLRSSGRFIAIQPTPSARWGPGDRGAIFQIVSGVEFTVSQIRNLRAGRIRCFADGTVADVPREQWPETEDAAQALVRAAEAGRRLTWLAELTVGQRTALALLVLLSRFRRTAAVLRFILGTTEAAALLASQGIPANVIECGEEILEETVDSAPGPYCSTQYLVPDTYASVSAALAQAEADGPTDVREIITSIDTTENITFAAVAWTARYFVIIRSNTPGTQRTITGSGGAVGINLNNRGFVQLTDVYALNATNVQVMSAGYRCRLQNVQTNGGNWGFYSGVAWGTRIVACNIHNHGQNGIASGGVIIDRTRVYDCTGTGILLSQGIGLARVQSCLIYKNGADGLRVTTTPVVVNIYNTVFFGNTGAGLSSTAADTSFEILNAVFRSNTTYGIDCNATLSAESQKPFLRCDYNCYSGNTTAIARISGTTYTTIAAWKAYTGDDANSNWNKATPPVQVDDLNPGFTNEGAGVEDFSLAVGSPLINAGTGAGVRWDYTGVEWPDLQHPAIGAYGNLDVEIDVWPAAVKVAVGTNTGPGGSIPGTRTDAAPDNVRLGSGQYGGGGVEFTPNCVVPVAASVKNATAVDVPPAVGTLNDLKTFAIVDDPAKDIGVAFAFTGLALQGVGPYTYAWTFGDGGNSPLQNPTHAYAAAGIYLVTLTVTDANGITQADTLQVEALAPAAAGGKGGLNFGSRIG